MKRPGALFLVRHGESGWNRERLIQGQSRMAPGLTTAGREDASGAADDLAGSGADLILASDLRRAVETALPIAARLGVPSGLSHGCGNGFSAPRKGARAIRYTPMYWG